MRKSTYAKDRTPYVGLRIGKDGKAAGILVPDAPHMLLLAGTGVGKSRRVLVPQILLWDGPVCAVSAKSDLAEMSATHRARRGGPAYIMDLTAQADWEQLPDDAIRLTNDPCSLLVPDEGGSTDDSAWDLAELLLQLGTLGTSDGQSGGGGDSAFWATLAKGTLAGLLQAGGWCLDENGEWFWGGGIDWVLQAALDTGLDETVPDDGPVDLTTPNWNTASRRAHVLRSTHSAEIESALELDAKQRDSIGINLRVALSNWKKRSVRGDGTAQSFTPELLEDPSATLYLVSPDTGGGAAAAAAVIESLVAHWKLHAIKKGLPKISMVIDECPQICPLPNLDRHLNVMRGYGMHFSVAAQGSSQYERRFGKAWSKVLLDTAPAILVGVGALEKELLDLAAWALPPSERKTESTDVRGAQSNLSSDRIEAFSSSELLPRHMGEARLLVRGKAGERVMLADYTDMLA